MPSPPEVFVAHPYTLMQTKKLIGRKQEIEILNNWISNSKFQLFDSKILVILAMGGTGKSALSWNWFQYETENISPAFKGKIWWSFYESDGGFDNFITQTLSYVSGQTIEEIQKLTLADRESALTSTLNNQRFLIVLDGFERNLIAYARMDAAYLQDYEIGTQVDNPNVDDFFSNIRRHSVSSTHHIRKTADPRIGLFLRKLTQIQESRVIINSRLFPYELETVTGDTVPGCYKISLTGLNSTDALKLWRNLGCHGSGDELLPFFDSFDNHPLIIRALAGEVSRYRFAPGDFNKWRSSQYNRLDPFSLPLSQRKTHILAYALKELSMQALKTVQIIASFRMPCQYTALVQILIEITDFCSDELVLDTLLNDLEDRGLIGWNRVSNKYDIHPVVRGVVLNSLNTEEQNKMYQIMFKYLSGTEYKIDKNNVKKIDDLNLSIELYCILIGLDKFEEACVFFRENIYEGLVRIGVSRPQIELLEMFFPAGIEKSSSLNNKQLESFLLESLAIGYQDAMQPGRATTLYRRQINITRLTNDLSRLCSGLTNLTGALLFTGAISEAFDTAKESLKISINSKDPFMEAVCLRFFGLTLAVRGEYGEAGKILNNSIEIFATLNNKPAIGVNYTLLSQCALWRGDLKSASDYAERAWELAHSTGSKGRDLLRAARLQGESAIGLGEYQLAKDKLHYSLTCARSVSLAEQELQALIALAELYRIEGKYDLALKQLSDAFEPAERGPYRPFLADAYIISSRINRDMQNLEGAHEDALIAYKTAWCSGPPNAYHSGLVKSKNLLEEFGIPIPFE